MTTEYVVLTEYISMGDQNVFGILVTHQGFILIS